MHPAALVEICYLRVVARPVLPLEEDFSPDYLLTVDLGPGGSERLGDLAGANVLAKRFDHEEL